MQNEQDIGTEGVAFENASVPPLNPVVTSKPGYLTSQFGVTAIITVICAVFMWFGYNIEPSQIEGYIGTVERFAAMIIPFLTLLGTAVTYINSRGKIASNKINANSAIQVAQLAGIPGIGATLGGKNWKDPARYGKIAEIVGGFIPGIGGQIAKTGGSAVQEIFDANKLTPDEQAQLQRLLEKSQQR